MNYLPSNHMRRIILAVIKYKFKKKKQKNVQEDIGTGFLFSDSCRLLSAVIAVGSIQEIDKTTFYFKRMLKKKIQYFKNR